MQGGYAVATSGDRVVIRDCSTNGLNGAAWLYGTDGTFIRNLPHNGQGFGSSVDIIDDEIIVGAYYDDEVETNAASIFIYSSDGDFQDKILAPDGQASDYIGSCVSASGSYLVVGAPTSGAAYMFPLSD